MVLEILKGVGYIVGMLILAHLMILWILALIHGSEQLPRDYMKREVLSCEDCEKEILVAKSLGLKNGKIAKIFLGVMCLGIIGWCLLKIIVPFIFFVTQMSLSGAGVTLQTGVSLDDYCLLLGVVLVGFAAFSYYEHKAAINRQYAEYLKTGDWKYPLSAQENG